MWHGYFKLEKTAGFSAENKIELNLIGNQSPNEAWKKTQSTYSLDNKKVVCEMQLPNEPVANDFLGLDIDDFEIFDGGEDACSSDCCHIATEYLCDNFEIYYVED